MSAVYGGVGCQCQSTPSAEKPWPATTSAYCSPACARRQLSTGGQPRRQGKGGRRIRRTGTKVSGHQQPSLHAWSVQPLKHDPQSFGSPQSWWSHSCRRQHKLVRHSCRKKPKAEHNSPRCLRAKGRLGPPQPRGTRRWDGLPPCPSPGTRALHCKRRVSRGSRARRTKDAYLRRTGPGPAEGTCLPAIPKTSSRPCCGQRVSGAAARGFAGGAAHHAGGPDDSSSPSSP